jgi:beta-glucanase (GH16 family)
MPAPAGYSASQLIFDDTFAGTSLNASHWVTYMGAQGIVWNDEGHLPLPYSGPNQGGTDLEMYAPSQVSVDNGLTISAQRNTNQYAGPYPWLSGVVTTEGKFSLPATGWYVQARMKLPDQSHGMWPGMWFLPSGSGAFNEIDSVQGGFSPCNAPNQNYCPLGTGYFASGGQLIGEAIPNVGFDSSAGYHTFGVEWKPGVGVSEFVDGKDVWSVSESEVPGGIVAQAYEIILNLQVAANSTAGWRTITTASTPTSSMQVSEVQAYS